MKKEKKKDAKQAAREDSFIPSRFGETMALDLLPRQTTQDDREYDDVSRVEGIAAKVVISIINNT